MRIENALWFKFPMSLRKAFWKETEFNTIPPTGRLLKAIEDAIQFVYLDLPIPEYQTE